jgi:hypothetical protein
MLYRFIPLYTTNVGDVAQSFQLELMSMYLNGNNSSLNPIHLKIPMHIIIINTTGNPEHPTYDEIYNKYLIHYPLANPQPLTTDFYKRIKLHVIQKCHELHQQQYEITTYKAEGNVLDYFRVHFIEPNELDDLLTQIEQYALRQRLNLILQSMKAFAQK